MSKILVLGATGDVGSQLVKELEARGQAVRAASRQPLPPTPAGTSWVRFDLEDPSSFGPALEGVDRVFLMARPGDDNPQVLALPLIQAMQQAGVKQVVNLSAIGVEDFPDFGLRQVERGLEASGLGYTHLRPNWFMQIFSSGPLLAQIQASGMLRLPLGETPVAYIHSQDIATAAAVALCETGHLGKAYTLTGPESLDHHAITCQLSQVSGREINYQAIPEETAADLIRASGLSEARVARILGFYRLVRQGLGTQVSPDLAQLLGRPGIDFASFARAHAHCWDLSLADFAQL